MTNGYSNRLRKSLSLQQPTGFWTNGFAYDTTKRLTNVTSKAGAFGYSYDPTLLTHHASLLTLPNTSYITNAFDGNARLITTYLKKSDNSVFDSYAYLYNPANQRTNLTRFDSSTVGYQYDRIGQLKVADSSVNSEDRGYTYDAAWNLNWLTNNGSASQFVVDNKNELTNAYGAENTYDSNGNLLTANYSRDFFFYNDENLLIQYYHFQNGIDNPATGDTRTDFLYDGLMRLRVRFESSLICTGGVQQLSAPPAGQGLDTPTNCQSTMAVETDYIYDGMRVIQERIATAPSVSYTRGVDLSGTLEGAGGIGGLLSRSSGSSGNWTTHNYYFADGNGNITYMLNNSQSMVASYRYDPFGNTISSSGTLANANVYRFSSKEIHVNSGIYYFGYRFYDPSLQRWITDDPTFEDTDPVTLTSVQGYTFVDNEPVAHWDALGRATAGGGVPTTSWKEHESFLTFTVTCPVHEQVAFDGFDHSGALPALQRLFGVRAVNNVAGPTPPAEGLGALDSLIDPNPKGVNCDGKPVQVIVWMRSRFASPAWWFAGSKAAAGAAAYAAGSVINYHCEQCVCNSRLWRYQTQ